MVSLVFDHISAHQAPYDKRFFFIQVQIRFYRPVRSATVRSLRRVTPFEPFTFLYCTCRGHVRREHNTGNPPAETPFEALLKLGERLEVAEEVAEEMAEEMVEETMEEILMILITAEEDTLEAMASSAARNPPSSRAIERMLSLSYLSGRSTRC
jgi:hypothetical protein